MKRLLSSTSKKIDALKEKEIKQNKIAVLTELMYSNLSNFVVAEMLQNKIDKLTKEIDEVSIYTELKNDPSDDIMTKQEFIDACENGMFTDYDGFGYPMKDGYSAGHDHKIYPSAKHLIPENATHIIWFNR